MGLFGNDGRKCDIVLAVVDEAVCMAHRTVVDVAGVQGETCAVVQDGGGAGGEDDDFAVGLVGMETDAAAGSEAAFHNTALAVEVHLGIEGTFTTFELRMRGLWNLGEINKHRIRAQGAKPCLTERN